ncbi:hypothetical protein LCGC14_2295510 [marine sediment metagenome]|uniref:N-acetyltransferase domain-containing protein n=1 Tax=marine sediment metagenome TaxID=412755 RepID=A0A0F9F2H0_9ZZZZ
MRNKWITDYKVILNRHLSDYYIHYDWLVEEQKPLTRKKIHIPFFPYKVLSCGNTKLYLYRNPLKLRVKDGWIELSNLIDEDINLVGSILLGDTQIGSIDKLSHDGECTSLETIFIEPQYRGKCYGTDIIKLLLNYTKNRGSKKFIIREIITEQEGLEYTHNPYIFRKIAQSLVIKKFIKSFYFNCNTLDSRRLNLVMELV